MKQPEKIDFAIICSIFKRNTEKNTRKTVNIFEDFPDNIKQKILSEVKLLDEEQTAITGFVNCDYWFLLTNCRFIQKKDTKSYSILLENIKYVDFDMQRLLAMTPRKISNIQDNKLLKVILKNEQILFFDVCQSGSECLAMLQVLRWISSKNKTL